jgi:hypothetical protein
VARLWPTTLGGVPGADVLGVVPFKPGEGDVPGPTEVEVGVVLGADEAAVVVVVDVFDGDEVVVVVFRAEEGVVELVGDRRMPATARFCCAETCGPLEHAAVTPASARIASGMTPLLRVPCSVVSSFPAPRAGQGTARKPLPKQRKNPRGKPPGYVR